MWWGSVQLGSELATCTGVDMWSDPAPSFRSLPMQRFSAVHVYQVSPSIGPQWMRIQMYIWKRIYLSYEMLTENIRVKEHNGLLTSFFGHWPTVTCCVCLNIAILWHVASVKAEKSPLSILKPLVYRKMLSTRTSFEALIWLLVACYARWRKDFAIIILCQPVMFSMNCFPVDLS